jgi:hypothetical protein
VYSIDTTKRSFGKITLLMIGDHKRSFGKIFSAFHHFVHDEFEHNVISNGARILQNKNTLTRIL